MTKSTGVGRGAGGGAPTKKPTAKERLSIRAMAGYGFDERKIATVMQIARETLRKHCQKELEQGRDQADSKVVESLA